MQELVTRHNVNQHKANEVCAVGCGHLSLFYNIKLWHNLWIGVRLTFLSNCLSMHSLVRHSTSH